MATPCIHSPSTALPNIPPNAQSDLQLNPAYLPDRPLYGNAENLPEDSNIGWELAAQPLQLTPEQHAELLAMGPMLLKFNQALELLYQQSLKGQQPELFPRWIADWLNQGKPEALLKFSQMKRFKGQLPLVIRPDLLLTEDGFKLTELDSVPGGIGFVSALNEAYRQSGFPVLEAEGTFPLAFYKTLQTLRPELKNPTIAIILSDEAKDYRQEMQWLVEHLQTKHAANIHLLHPRDVDLIRDQLVFQNDQGEDQAIDILYRFFELFDLANIPKMELIQYALKKGIVTCTPPFKAHLEEKLALALIHQPILQKFWLEQLGEATYQTLLKLIPQTWVLDPTPLPPQAVIPNLTFQKYPIQHFRQLAEASQKERELVIKPSGFSPLAWGSRGVTIGHDVSQVAWAEALQAGLASFGQTPYVLQHFHKPKVVEGLQHLLPDSTTKPFPGRLRICPYYLVTSQSERVERTTEQTAELASILVTACPPNKKIIHGMKDGIMTSAMLTVFPT